MQNKSLLSLIGLLALALLIVLAHRLAPSLQLASETLPVSQCNLQQETCIASLPGGTSVSLTISPHPMPVLQPLQVEGVIGGSPQRVALELTGVDMDMGQNRIELQAVAPGRYQDVALSLIHI